MKISIDGVPFFEILDIHKKIICDDVNSDIVDADIKRRLQWVIEHKCSFNMERLKNFWVAKFKAEGIESLPTDDLKLAEMIFAHPDYKDAKQRQEESEKMALRS